MSSLSDSTTSHAASEVPLKCLQTVGGKQTRWDGIKKSKISEWDSLHGELECYRASDGSHLGAFDPASGKQVKGSDPKRSIKNFLERDLWA